MWRCVPCHAQGGLGLLLELGLFRGVQTAVAVFGLTMLHVAGLVGLLCLARPVVKPSKLPLPWPVNTVYTARLCCVSHRVT